MSLQCHLVNSLLFLVTSYSFFCCHVRANVLSPRQDLNDDYLLSFYTDGELDADNSITDLESSSANENDAFIHDHLFDMMLRNAEKVQRRKRVGGGVLGLDNIDYAVSTLDRARGRPMSIGGGESASSQLPLSIGSPSRSTSASSPSLSTGRGIMSVGRPNRPRPMRPELSVNVGVKDLRKMMDLLKAGR